MINIKKQKTCERWVGAPTPLDSCTEGKQIHHLLLQPPQDNKTSGGPTTGIFRTGPTQQFHHCSPSPLGRLVYIFCKHYSLRSFPLLFLGLFLCHPVLSAQRSFQTLLMMTFQPGEYKSDNIDINIVLCFNLGRHICLLYIEIGNQQM